MDVHEASEDIARMLNVGGGGCVPTYAGVHIFTIYIHPLPANYVYVVRTLSGFIFPRCHRSGGVLLQTKTK